MRLYITDARIERKELRTIGVSSSYITSTRTVHSKRAREIWHCLQRENVSPLRPIPLTDQRRWGTLSNTTMHVHVFSQSTVYLEKACESQQLSDLSGFKEDRIKLSNCKDVCACQEAISTDSFTAKRLFRCIRRRQMIINLFSVERSLFDNVLCIKMWCQTCKFKQMYYSFIRRTKANFVITLF